MSIWWLCCKVNVFYCFRTFLIARARCITHVRTWRRGERLQVWLMEAFCRVKAWFGASSEEAEFHQKFLWIQPLTIACLSSPGPRKQWTACAPTWSCLSTPRRIRRASELSVWPLAANILDPVRVSVVCTCASHIVQVPSSCRRSLAFLKVDHRLHCEMQTIAALYF